MTEPKPIYTERLDQIQADLLAVRQQAIGLTVTTERLLETLGRPVESAIVTRRERRKMIQSTLRIRG